MILAKDIVCIDCHQYYCDAFASGDIHRYSHNGPPDGVVVDIAMMILAILSITTKNFTTQGIPL
jgi:hypothetical protein